MLKEEDKTKKEPVDFAVTARKYKTLLTRKYKERKPWTTPSPYEIYSYIPGTVIRILVDEGDKAKEGDTLLILEAMKMQNRVEIPFSARIKKINIKEGDRIPKDFLMIELESIEK
ncbi:MAG: acetyl-CoA carboxylase biotin carboxyl carrier protein subunit [Prevotellaceae bacterium]|jgi:biotin carboxyl carrier protein|nr:acetyl-CoA carboxylase biotin carboxyl carrier protein subunit [Prevotellaceae bacterium]